MKKLSLIPIALIVLVGAIWAATSSPSTPSYPADTSGFIRNPVAPGTLGYALSLFGSDGSAKDTLALSGISATGYVQGAGANCDGSKVWVGFTEDGIVECGTIGTLLTIGEFSEIDGTIAVNRNGAWDLITIGYKVKEGDIIKTDSTSTGTIDFDADDSIIRIGTNTVVELRTGDLEGNTVAEAIVNSGSLWGRILSSTGVNIGGGGLIAGVRGTSISVAQNTAGQYIFSIIDSQLSQTAALLSLASGDSVRKLEKLQVTKPFASGSLSDIGNLVIETKTLSGLLADPTTKKNLIADLDYLATTLDTVTTGSDREDTIIQEIESAIPQDQSAIEKLSPPGSSASDAVKISEGNNKDRDDSTLPDDKEAKIKAKRTSCHSKGKTYIVKKDDCIDGISILAYREFGTSPTTNTGELELWGYQNQWDLTASDGSTNTIDGIGDYLAYTLSDSQKEELKGKTVTITLNDRIQDNGNFFILDFSDSLRFSKKNGNWKCSWNPSNICGNSLITSNYEKIIKITLPTNQIPERMIIGNAYIESNHVWGYHNPINRIINKITIE